MSVILRVSLLHGANGFDPAQQLVHGRSEGVDEPFGLLDDLFDYGGVHGNSLVWTNALWKIRKRFAAEDGGNLITSKGAKKFDRVVYRALTTYFTNETDMASAAGAVYQASLDLSDVTAAEQQMIVEQFVASELCDGCSLPATQNNDPVVVSSHLKFRPSVTKSGVVYTEYLGSPGTTSFAVTAHYVPLDGSARPRQISPRGWNTFGVVARGDYAFEQMLDATYTKGLYVLHNLATGKDETIEAPDADSMALTAPAISAKRVLWAGVEGDHVVVRSRAITGGPIATVTVSDFPLQVGIDGDFAAFELKDGTIWTWDTTTTEAHQVYKAGVLDPLPTQRPGQIVVVGTEVFALVAGDDEVHWQVVHIGANAKAETLSTSAFPAGLAADGNVVVWAETTGIVRTGVAGVLKRGDVVDSDLIAYSTATGHYGAVVQQRGQQGFPSLRGTHLVWQDSLAGADDIYGLTLDTGF